MTPEEARELAERLRLFAQPQRLMILDLLMGGALAVSDIEARTGIGQPTLSQQIGALRRAGVISARRDSRSIYYSFTNEREQNRAWVLLGILREKPRQDTLPAPRPTDASRRVAPEGGAHFARISRG